jgi:hypothetical protein
MDIVRFYALTTCGCCEVCWSQTELSNNPLRRREVVTRPGCLKRPGFLG